MENILLVSTLENMLIADEDERASFLELKQSLPSWGQIEPFLRDNQFQNDSINFSQQTYGFL